MRIPGDKTPCLRKGARVVLAALALSACSPAAEFPAVLDRPEPRADKPMTPDEVKEVTNSLISDRDHLTAETQSAAPTTAQASTPAGRHTVPAKSTRKEVSAATNRP